MDGQVGCCNQYGNPGVELLDTTFKCLYFEYFKCFQLFDAALYFHFSKCFIGFIVIFILQISHHNIN